MELISDNTMKLHQKIMQSMEKLIAINPELDLETFQLELLLYSYSVFTPVTKILDECVKCASANEPWPWAKQ